MNTLTRSLCRSLLPLALLCVGALFAPRCSAAPGALDPTFGGTGKVTTPIGSGDDYGNSVVVQGDGKIIVAGFGLVAGGSGNDFALVRYNPDGTLDMGFGVNGKVSTPIGIGGSSDQGNSVAVQSDGKIIVVGVANNDFALARYHGQVATGTPGTLDASFNPTGGTPGTVITSFGSGTDVGYSVAVQTDGKIVVAGFSYNGSNNDFALARYKASGELDTTFGPGGTGKVLTAVGSGNDIGYSVALQGDGKIIVAGYSDNGGNADFAVVRYHGNAATGTPGTVDASFNSAGAKPGMVITLVGSGNDIGNSLAVQGDGKIVVAGYSSNGGSDDFELVRYHGSMATGMPGTLDASFGNGGKVITPVGGSSDHDGGMTVQGDGKIIVAGFASNGSNDDFALVRYTAGGALDMSFGNGGKVITPIGSANDEGASVAVQNDGKIIVSGNSSNGSNNDFAIVRYLVSPPIATTAAATGVTTSGATLNGMVNPSGAPTTAVFEYGLTTSYGSLVNAFPSPGGGGQPVAISAAINGLLPNQTYHYRLTATNAVDTSNGVDMTFMTGANAPIVTTGMASAVTATGATISGTVNPNGSVTTNAIVEYGLTPTYGMSVNVSPNPGGGTAPVAVSAMLSGLMTNQTYHFRVSATTQAGGTSAGADATFTTGATAPTITTGGASPDVNGLGATLSGTANPNGSATTAVFEYGLTASYGATVVAVPSAGSGNSPVNVSAMIGGLTPSRTYHFRLTGTNTGGSVVGSDATFNTPGVLPSATTLAATDVTNTGATLHGTVNPNGSSTMVRFSYGPAGTALNFTTNFVAVGSAAGDIPVSAIVTGLAPFTDYEFRLEAEASGIGTQRGDRVAFKTLLTTLAALPDKAFAILDGAPFDIDVLANDPGDGLFISGLVPASPRGVIINGDQLNFTPLDLTHTEATSETFSYQVNDAGQNSAQAVVTVYYFLGLRGTYFGNFTEVAGTSRVLRCRLDLDYAGLASGRLEWEGEQYPFKVQFDGAGHAQVAKARAGATKVTLVADLQLDPLAPNMSIAFRDSGSSPTTLNDKLQLVPADLNVVPQKGMQIAFIDPGEQGAGGASAALGTLGNIRPDGIGFSQVRVTGKKGRARFMTVMPDFGAFSAGKPLVASNGVDLPRYDLGFQVYKRAGSTLGAVSGDAFASHASTGLDRLSGALGWQRLLSSGGSENLIALVEGFPYQTGPGGVPFGLTPNAKVRLSGGGLGKTYEFGIAIKHKMGAAADTATQEEKDLGLALKFNFAAGIFTGSFNIPATTLGGTPEKVKIIGGMGIEPGVFLATVQAEPRLRGSFFVKSAQRTGRIKITPTP